MSDVLSQNEIDDLLAALSTGEVDVTEIEEDKREKRVRKYDFSRPDKFAKDQLRTLEIIHENFSRLLNNFLSGYLRIATEVNVISTQSLIYSEFNNSISNPAILGIVEFAPLDGELLIDFSNDIAFAMIERILGGSGRNAKPKENRSLTEIEMTLLNNILMKFINLLKEPWGNIIEIRPKLLNIETNSQFAQITSPTESVALITFNLKIGRVEGMINICIPHYVIEPILPELSSKLWFSKTGKKALSDDEKTALKKGLGKSNIEMRTVIGRSRININDFLNLQRGDVIVLDKPIEEDFEVYIGDHIKFRGQPGIRNKRVALRITDVMEKGDENDG